MRRRRRGLIVPLSSGCEVLFGCWICDHCIQLSPVFAMRNSGKNKSTSPGSPEGGSQKKSESQEHPSPSRSEWGKIESVTPNTRIIADDAGTERDDSKDKESGGADFTPDRGAKSPLAATPEQTSPLQELHPQQNSPSLSLVPSQVKNSSPSQNGGCSGNDSLPDAQPRGCLLYTSPSPRD